MSNFDNPYQSPESPIVPEVSQNLDITMSVTMFKYLNETSPWLRFIGILGYIGSGITVLSGILFTISMFTASDVFSGFAFPVWVFALIYIPLGVLFFFPAHFIYNFGQKIRNYRFSNSIEDLELAFKNNKSYWKFLGIICIIYLAIIPFIIVIAVIAGVMTAVTGM